MVRGTPEQMGEEAYADLRRALHDPEVVHAMLEDYRAGLREDHDHDAADRAAGRRITSPLLVISLLQDDPDLDYGTDILDIWRAWATDVRGAAIDCGHHVAEEKPDELARLLLDFLSGGPVRRPLGIHPCSIPRRARYRRGSVTSRVGEGRFDSLKYGELATLGSSPAYCSSAPIAPPAQDSVAGFSQRSSSRRCSYSPY